MAVQFEIEEALIGDTLVLTPLERVDSSVARKFEEFMSSRVQQASGNLVVDFSKLAFISSAGMRVLLLAAKMLKSTGGGGTLVLCGMRDSIREIFSISGFDRIINICDTLDEALHYGS